MGSPLPLFPSEFLDLGSEYLPAYSNVLQAESYVLRLQADASAIQHKIKRETARKEANGKLVSVRVAGHMLLDLLARPNLLGAAPSTALVQWLTLPPQSHQSHQHDVVIEIGTLLREKLLRVFRTVSTAYSQPSSHTSSETFDTLEDMLMDMMKSTEKSYGKSRDKMLARHNFRCVVTGIYNRATYQQYPQIARGQENVVTLPLHTTHIFNEGTMRDIDPAVRQDSKVLNKTCTAAATLGILESFGFSGFVNAFRESVGVHEIWNLLTMESNIHDSFDSLYLWFEPTDQPHRYQICSLDETLVSYIRRIRIFDDPSLFVEFNAQEASAPPPHPHLLALHAMCARVAHMSGAAEFFDEIDRDVEETVVLASNGSTAPLLSNLLSSHADLVPAAV